MGGAFARGHDHKAIAMLMDTVMAVAMAEGVTLAMAAAKTINTERPWPWPPQ